jgi:hypothetical protein
MKTRKNIKEKNKQKMTIDITLLNAQEKHALFVQLVEGYPLIEPTDFHCCEECGKLGSVNSHGYHVPCEFFICEKCDNEFCEECSRYNPVDEVDFFCVQCKGN